MKCGGCSGRDLVSGWSAVALWCVPTAVVIAGVFLPGARAILWIPSFAIMGIACLVNARGCGRLHCHVTGPLFLLAALATGLDAFGVVHIAPMIILVGATLGTLFAYGFEWLFGKYIATSVP